MISFILSVLLAPLLIPTLAHAQTLPRGQWTQVGSTSLYSAFWRAGSNDHFIGTGAGTGQTSQGGLLTSGLTMMESYGSGSGGIEGMYAYAGGGAFDSTRQEWVYCCTTADAYWGTNEVAALNVTTGVWTRPMDPTVGIWVPPTRAWPSSTYANGQAPITSPTYIIDADNAYPNHVTPSDAGGIHAYPNSRQSYGCQVYMPSVQKFFMLGGYPYHAPSGNSGIIFEWTPPPTARWQMIDSQGVISDSLVLDCLWDPDQQRVLISSGFQLRAYNPVTKAVRTLVEDNFASQNDTGHMVYDTKRHRVLKVTPNPFDSNHGRYYDFDGSGNVIGAVSHGFTLTGSANYTGRMGPMILYDPIIDKYVYYSGGATLTVIDPVTFVGVDQTPGGATPSQLTDINSMGGYHKWFYNPANDTYNAAALTVTGPGLFVFAPVRMSPSR